MSTATAPAPAKPVVIEDLTEILSKAPAQFPDAKGKIPVPNKPPEKPLEKQIEPEQKKAEPEKSAEPPTKDLDVNIKQLREQRDSFEKNFKDEAARREAFQKELEELKLAGALPEVRNKLKELEKERDELRSHLRAADLSRDPAFNAKYTKPIQRALVSMEEIATASGVPKEDVSKVIGEWDVKTMGEWVSAMNPLDQAEFGAALRDAKRLYVERADELKDADGAWQKTQEAAKQNQERAAVEQRKMLTHLSDSIEKEVLSTHESFAGDETLKTNLKTAFQKLTAGEWGPKEIYGQVAVNQVLSALTLRQRTELDSAETIIADLRSKLAEQEKFIKGRSSAIPGGNATGDPGKAGDDDSKKPLWEQVIHVGGR